MVNKCWEQFFNLLWRISDYKIFEMHRKIQSENVMETLDRPFWVFYPNWSVSCWIYSSSPERDEWAHRSKVKESVSLSHTHTHPHTRRQTGHSLRSYGTINDAQNDETEACGRSKLEAHSRDICRRWQLRVDGWGRRKCPFKPKTSPHIQKASDMSYLGISYPDDWIWNV